MSDRYDVIVIGAGIAGLGVAAILAKEANQKVLVLDRYQKEGGRLMSWDGYPEKGWRFDLGLHAIELGEKSRFNELNNRIGKKIEWAPFSESVEFWDGNKFINIGEMVAMSKDDKKIFVDLMMKIAALNDSEIDLWDNRSFEEWLQDNVSQSSIRELLSDFGMLMTTISKPIDMAAGEVLYIARDNLIKVRQITSASYPLHGMAGITRGLVEVINENGGEIRLNCDVDEVLIADGKALGVRIPINKHIYPKDYRMYKTENVYAERIVCALPIYHLDRIIDFNPKTSPMPEWWIKRISDIRNEITGGLTWIIGLSEPIVDPHKLSFYSALKTRNAKLAFQCFPASNFTTYVAPEGKQLLQAGVVLEHSEASDKFERKRLQKMVWEDIKEMFAGIEEKMEWKLDGYVDGCDGLARKPGLVGNFKPGLKAPGITNLFFAGDTYTGRGLATNGAALSAMHCADLIMNK